MDCLALLADWICSMNIDWPKNTLNKFTNKNHKILVAYYNWSVIHVYSEFVDQKRK